MSELTDQMMAGRPVDVDAIVGWQYRGTSLGLPSWIERLTWKTFIKVFHRDADGIHRGWNVRCHQDDGRPKVKRSVPVTFGHFAIVACPDDYPVPDGALLLDYGAYGINATSALRDPLVALDDRGDTLLGCSFVSIAGRKVATPSFFRLERLRRVEHVTYPER
jgi:hypothetical protein